MKIGLIIYHKDIFSYIPNTNILECLESLSKQTFNKYDIFELDYSEKEKESTFLTELGLFPENKIRTFRKECRNHIEAMNYLLNKTFKELEYDIIFNVNLDDVYNVQRVEKQLIKALEGYDLISSNYRVFQEKDGEVVKREMRVMKSYEEEEDEQHIIKIKIGKNHNFIPTSSMCFTRKCWGVLESIPYLPGAESLLICKKVLKSKLKIHVCPEILVDYRIHKNQVSARFRRSIV